MAKKTKTVYYEITYRSWTENPPYRCRETQKIDAADDADAIQKFYDIRLQYERCDGFKLIKIERETRTSNSSGFPRSVIIIIKTQLA